ncbi:hypothetical protein SCOCK_100133 [Actinacidiphila cocklensis]|uniref:Uncharacterized protein n=1 Tax=Actinacidiphila cocklensis TaxID=887465 RepID=A0A9W4DJ58_9ACTN|nr:hypothetical protein SCOCK_100133 [Actinacidiphila cocklensis]
MSMPNGSGYPIYSIASHASRKTVHWTHFRETVTLLLKS